MAASQEHVLRLELEPSSDPSECQDLSGKNKKKRGRPRKYPLVEGIPSVSVKRKRGRPPKARVEEEREGEESDEQEKERKGADDEEGGEDTQKKKKKKKTVMMNMKERMEQKRRGRPRKNPVSAFVHIAGLKQGTFFFNSLSFYFLMLGFLSRSRVGEGEGTEEEEYISLWRCW